MRELADHVYALVVQGHGLELVIASLLGRCASGTTLTAAARLARAEATRCSPDEQWLGVARKINLVQNFCPHLFDRSFESVAR